MKWKSSYFYCGLIALTASVANAVPLLRQTSADFTKDMATIYPDNADPNLFYFLPNKGGFAKDSQGKPLFGLVTYGLRDPDPKQGGGYLTFVMEAGITDPLRTELQTFRSSHPNARLSVVPFGKSSILIGDSAAIAGTLTPAMKTLIPDPTKPAPKPDAYPQVLGGLGALFTDLILPPSAGVAESQVGGNGTLTQIGARVFRAGISNPNLFTLSLCFEIYGALPTMEAKMYMDYQKVYEYFSTSASGGWGWFGWSLGGVVEKLRQDKVIDWEIIGGDAKDEDYVKLIAKELAETYLKPNLSNTPGTTGGYTPFSAINFGMNYTYKEERSTATYHMKRQAYITDDRCIALPMSELYQWKDQVVQSAD